MKDLSPEAMQQLLVVLPLFALLVALFVTAVLLVLGAVFGLFPGVYQDRPNVGVIRRKAVSVLLIGAIACGGFGFLSVSLLNNHLSTATDIIYNTESAPSYNEE